MVIQKYGADAVRLYMMHSGAVKGEDFKLFARRAFLLVLRQFMIPLWNAYFFLATYAKIYSWKPEASSIEKPEISIDRWILSRLNRLVQEVENAMDQYQLSSAVDPFVDFINQFDKTGIFEDLVVVFGLKKILPIDSLPSLHCIQF